MVNAPVLRKVWWCVVVSLSACQLEPAAPQAGDPDLPDRTGRLEATVLEQTRDGVPTFIQGKLGVVTGTIDDAGVRAAIADALAAFRLRPDDLKLRKVHVDEQGSYHFRYDQTFHGLDVIGGDLVVHVDRGGRVFLINGTARGDLDPMTRARRIDSNRAIELARAALPEEERGASLSIAREVYVIGADESRHRALELVGKTSQMSTDGVLGYLDLVTGQPIGALGGVRESKNRRILDSANGANVPARVERLEGDAPSLIADVDFAYDNLGDVYDAYLAFWGRDSYDNRGSTIVAVVRDPAVGAAGAAAWWNTGAHEIHYAPGVPHARNVSSHEYTHGVNQSEWNPGSGAETKGIDEGIADSFAPLVEGWVTGGRSGQNLLLTPTTWTNDNCNPGGYDFYTGSVSGIEVHEAGHPVDIAMCLLARGGVHPTGKSHIRVPAIGLGKATGILYKAVQDYFTSNLNYATIRTAMEQAAIQTGNSAAVVNAIDCAWAAVGVGEVPASCSDGDILWRDSDGTVAVWYMNGGTQIANNFFGRPGNDWQIAGTGDFDGDGRSDLLWRDSDGTVALWFMAEGQKIGEGYPTVHPGNDWHIEGVGDFTGGGQSDILWRNDSGQLAIWQMNGSNIVGQTYPTPTFSRSFLHVQGIGDFNHDGISDVLWRNAFGQVGIMFGDKTVAMASITSVQAVTADWSIKGVGDFDGDGKSDILWRNTDGTLAIWFMDGSKNTAQGYPGKPGNDWVVSGITDFNGDGKDDLVWRDTDGTVAIWFMSGATNVGQAYPGKPGNDWVIQGTGYLD